MSKKLLLFFALILMTGNAVFAQESLNFPRNSMSIDGGGLLASLIASAILYDPEEKGTALITTSLQYEYQFVSVFSLAGRVEYKMFNSSGSTLNMSSISAQAHARFYPDEDFFFLDAMIGYAYFTMTDMPASHFFKFGGKLGWRIDFKEPGGFFIEPFLGYTGSLGKSNVDFNKGNESSFSYELNDFNNTLYNLIIKGYFVSGPVYGLGVGYRF